MKLREMTQKIISELSTSWNDISSFHQFFSISPMTRSFVEEMASLRILNSSSFQDHLSNTSVDDQNLQSSKNLKHVFIKHQHQKFNDVSWFLQHLLRHLMVQIISPKSQKFE